MISQLTGEWEQDYDRWQRRDLSARRYVYIWADGVYLQARMEPQAECILVILGATPEVKKEVVGLVLSCLRLLRYMGATARHAIYGGQWRRSDRSRLGRKGP